jgi:hypothetical protein
MSNIYTGSTKDASYQISIHLPKRFQRRFLQAILVSDWLISKKSLKSLWQMNQNLVGSIVGTTSIKNAHLVAIHKQTCHCLCRPCLLTDRDKISNIYRGHSKDGSYQVLIHLAKRFQKRRFFRDQPIRSKNGQQT